MRGYSQQFDQIFLGKQVFQPVVVGCDFDT